MINIYHSTKALSSKELQDIVYFSLFQKGNTCISAFCTVHQPSPPSKSVKICCDQLEELKEEEPKKVRCKL